MRTHPLPGLIVLLVAATLAGCPRNPATEAAAAQALTDLADQLGAIRQENAALQEQVDSLRLVVARQDTVLRRLANMAGVQMP